MPSLLPSYLPLLVSSLLLLTTAAPPGNPPSHPTDWLSPPSDPDWLAPPSTPPPRGLPMCGGPRILDAATPAAACIAYARSALMSSSLPSTSSAQDFELINPTTSSFNVHQPVSWDDPSNPRSLRLPFVSTEGRCTISIEWARGRRPANREVKTSWYEIGQTAVMLAELCVRDQGRVWGEMVLQGENEETDGLVVELALNTGRDEEWQRIMAGEDERPFWTWASDWVQSRVSRASKYMTYQVPGRDVYP